MLQDPDSSFCGNLDKSDTELLELFEREGIEFDLLWVPNPASKQGLVGSLWATLYGDRDIARDLGDTLQNLDIYLQDPIYSLRDVLYWNPHKFSNGEGVRTTFINVKVKVEEDQSKKKPVAPADILANFVSEDTLPETEGSALLTTKLKGYESLWYC